MREDAADKPKQYFNEYAPQPKQMELHKSSANDIMFGGAAGPGKSHALRHEGAMWCTRIPNLQVYLFRRTNPELEKTHVIKSQAEFPEWLGTWSEGKKRWNWFNGSMFHFCHCQYEQDVFNYQGAEINALLVDEASTFTPFQLDYLIGRTRCEMDIEERFRHKIPLIIFAGNPGGVGHQYCKQRYVDFNEPYKIKRAPKDEGGMRRQYIPGLLQDNPILMKNDPGYINRLKALPEPYRSAYLLGDWDLFIGQMFAFNYKHHVIKPVPVPADAPLYMTFDWGFGHPYSCGWWWIDADGRAYRFGELYGCKPDEPNVGLRQTDDQIAELILMQEEVLGISGRNVMRLSGHDCWNKKPDYGSGGQSESTATVFAREGVHLVKGDPNRVQKIRQFHLRLRAKVDKDGEIEEMPMLVVYDTCKAFIRTVPTLMPDPNNPEYVDKRQEDHVFEESALLCQALGEGSHNATLMELAAQAGV